MSTDCKQHENGIHGKKNKCSVNIMRITNVTQQPEEDTQHTQNLNNY
jgi:hypothetical protein